MKRYLLGSGLAFSAILSVLVLLIAGNLIMLNLAAQSTPHPGQLNYSLQTSPGAIPTSPTVVYSGDAYVCYAEITASGQTVTLQDRQATPVSFISGVLGSAMTATTWYWGPAPTDATCRHFPGGVSWSADMAGATGYLIIKHN